MIKNKNYTKEVIFFVCLSLLFTGILFIVPNISNYISAYLADTSVQENKLSVGYNTISVVEDFEPPKELVPGISFKKDVKIENTGTVDTYVRVKALFTNSDMMPYCTIDYNTTDWVFNNEDGYYYLINPVAVGETSPSLFTNVKLSDDIGITDIKDFDILIYAESYQSYGYDSYEIAWNDYYKNK